MPPAKPAPQLMPAPQSVPGVPPGLEYLSQIDQLLVNQQVELLESECSCSSKGGYLQVAIV